MLQPPLAPVVPGGFDFARRAYFLSLGAVGFAVSRPAIAAARDPPGIRARVNLLRQRITRRIASALPGAEGAVAAALTTGERGAIPERVLVAMRDAGLAHLLAISGLHFSLVAALLFGGLQGRSRRRARHRAALPDQEMGGSGRLCRRPGVGKKGGGGWWVIGFAVLLVCVKLLR